MDKSESNNKHFCIKKNYENCKHEMDELAEDIEMHHIINKDEKSVYTCVACPATFNRLSKLKIHSELHFSDKKFCCGCCDANFVSSRDLTKHRKTLHEGVPMCKKCKLTFAHQSSLKLHLKVHTGEKSYVCHECGASFVQSGHLNIHKRTHTGEKPYKCEICFGSFKQISHLKTHVRTHTHDRPYHCKICNASFTQNSSLTRHFRSHSGEKPYKCQYCEMSFVVKSNMQRHLFTHTGEKPYTCDLCTAAFGQAIDLKRHKISHSGIKPYKCKLCEATFSRKNNLKWHEMTHSDEASHKCEICNVRFSSGGDLRVHKRVHAPPKPYRCALCPSTFVLQSSLERHSMIHTGERPLRKKPDKKIDNKTYSCTACQASFCEKRNFKRHLIAVHEFEHDAVQMAFASSEGSNRETKKLYVKSEVVSDSNAYSSSCNTSVVLSDHTNLVVQALQDGKKSVAELQGLIVNEGITTNPISIPQLFLSSSPGQLPIPAKPANNCQNHTAHVLTYIEGSSNQWQSWCFCNPPNPANSEQPAVHFLAASSSTQSSIATTVVSVPGMRVLSANQTVQIQIPVSVAQ